MRRQGDREEGQIILTKPFVGKPGNFAVIGSGSAGGISAKQDSVKAELAAIFPDIEVTFP
jgi:hypothetical protein